MLCAADRREDEPVPQFYGRIDEKFAEWEIDVSLWQVEFKLEDRDRLGPRLYVSERFVYLFHTPHTIAHLVSVRHDYTMVPACSTIHGSTAESSLTCSCVELSM